MTTRRLPQLPPAERALLLALSGHCRSPIAGLATTDFDRTVELHAAVYTPDGLTCLEASERGAPEQAVMIGQAVAETRLAKGARALIDEIASALSIRPPPAVRLAVPGGR